MTNSNEIFKQIEGLHSNYPELGKFDEAGFVKGALQSLGRSAGQAAGAAKARCELRSPIAPPA